MRRGGVHGAGRMIRLLALAMLASLALLMPGLARAAATYPDEGAAYAGCQASGSSATADTGRKATGQFRCNPSPGRFVCEYEVKPFEREAAYYIVCGNFSPSITDHDYPADKRCSSRPYELGWQGGGTAATVNACHNGCMYTSSLDPQGTAGVGFFPTGGTCTESDAPAPTPAGDGGDPGEGGGGDGGGTDPGGGDGGGDNGGGDGDGGSGNPGGGDGGSGGGDGDGDGGGDGDGDGGGDGGGSGPGPSPGPGEGDGDGPGEVGSDGGPLYERDKNLTLDKVFNDFKQQAEKLPIIQATKSFFTVSVGGSCPVFTLPASQYWDTMTFDLHCYGVIYESFLLMGWVLLAIAAFMAAKIALT